MIAITITQELKDANKNLFISNQVGSIRLFSNIPKSFYSPTYLIGRRIDGYQNLDVSIHEADGFYPVISPTILITQIRGDIYFNVDSFTYEIIEKTQEQIDAEAIVSEDNDIAATELFNHKNNGIKSFDRILSLIIRRKNNGLITDNLAKNITIELYPLLEPLYKGQWRLVKINIDNWFLNPTTTNPDVILILTKIQEILDAYVLNNY